MKKILILMSFAVCTVIYAQQSRMVINNYSAYDYQGVLIATGLNSCYPMVGNTYSPTGPPNNYQMLKVAASATGNVGLYSSGTPVQYWDVQSSATNPVVIRPYNNVLLAPPSSPIFLYTDWQHSKFSMYYAGTNTDVPNTGINISSGSNACYNSPSYFSDPNSPVEAEWFTITIGIDKYSYLQIY